MTHIYVNVYGDTYSGTPYIKAHLSDHEGLHHATVSRAMRLLARAVWGDKADVIRLTPNTYAFVWIGLNPPMPKFLEGRGYYATTVSYFWKVRRGCQAQGKGFRVKGIYRKRFSSAEHLWERDGQVVDLVPLSGMGVEGMYQATFSDGESVHLLADEIDLAGETSCEILRKEKP